MDAPRDLTLPEPGSTTGRAVLSAALGRLLADLVAAPGRAPRSARGEAAALARLVQAARSEAPGALASALRRPTVGALLRCFRNDAQPGREALLVELTAALAFELALADALPGPVHLARAPLRLLSIPAGIAVSLPRDATGITLDNGRLQVHRPGSAEELDLRDGRAAASSKIAVARPYHRIEGEIALALVDNNPLAAVEAHPDKAGNAVDLGGVSTTRWTTALRAALGTLARYLPELRAEMDLFLHQVVPVGWDAERHLSASYQEAIGSIYLSLHPSEMTLAEALLHEFSHTKLNAFFELDPVLTNAWSPLYRSPIRPDPRPLHGVLLAVHAFLPVARLYERMIEGGDPAAEPAAFHQRFRTIRRINREGAALLLREALPTPLGRGLIEEIRRWDNRYAAHDGG